MDKVAKFNNVVMYLLVAVDVLSRFLEVEPTKSKNAADTTRAFKRMTTKTFPEKVWSDKGTEFKGEFKQFCDSKNVELYNTHSETQSAFAEGKIRLQKKFTNIWKRNGPITISINSMTLLTLLIHESTA